MWTYDKLQEHYQQQIDQWTRTGIKATGRGDLLNYFRGEELTRQEAIQAHCYQCMGGYGDGEDRDCRNPPCPLYPFHPHNPNKLKRELSPEQSEKLRKNLSRIRRA